MKKANYLLAALSVLALTAWLIKLVFPGQAAWGPKGNLLVAGKLELVPRWLFPRKVPSSMGVAVELLSREGAKVEALVHVAFPPGRYSLKPAADAAEGLKQVLLDTAPPLDVDCLSEVDCLGQWKRRWQESLSGLLGLPMGQVEVDLKASGIALAAARLAKLKAALPPRGRRVLLLGWDGGDWELLEPLARRGIMPVLKRLMDEGTWGKLESFTPLLSPIVWTTIATGEPPEVHGILDFLEVEPESGAKVPITGRKRAVPALWNIVSALGLSVGVCGWWASWPAEPVNGVVVSDRLFFLLSDAPGDAPPGTVVFPPERESHFRQLVTEAETQTDAKAVHAFLPVPAERITQALRERKGMADPVDGFRRLLISTKVYSEAGLEILEAKPDLAMVYLMGTDEVGHLLAPHLPPFLPGADPQVREVAATGVERYFALVDSWLGRLLEKCPLSECALVLVSDHGFKWGADRPRNFSGVAAATAAAWHRVSGIFLVAGSGVKKLGRVDSGSSVFDVAPTILALLELPVGTGWRGRMLPGVQTKPFGQVPWSQLVPPESYRPKGTPVTPSPEYVAQLRALGYLEGSEGEGSAASATEGELNNLGLVHLDAKRYREAEEAFRQAIAKNPNYASPYYNLRRLYFETGRYDEADAALEEAIKRGLRDGAGAMARAVGDYQNRGLSSRALKLASRARVLFPQEPRFAAQLLALYVQLGRCEDGLGEAHSATRDFPQDPGVLSFAGLAAACAGEAALARGWLAASLQLLPDQPEIRKALEALPK
ncbi:MAG: alkaline phosphatase family protein [Thermoanaerobaculaceae bacterium]